MRIGFDVSQTGSGKAGCGYFSHAMILALLEIAPEHQYSLFPSFGDFYFDARMPLHNPYVGDNVHYGPRHLSREAAQVFWNSPSLDQSLRGMDIVQANNFWCPVQIASSRVIYTFYDMGFAIDPTWSKEANRIGCFDGVFRSSVAADWIVAISEASRSHYLSVFPHFPEDRVTVIYPCSRFTDPALNGKRPKGLGDVIKENGYWLTVGTIEPRKNQHRLARAYARYIALGGEPMPLVFAGGEGWLMDDFRSYINELGIAERVVFTGYISDDELIWLYRNCYGNLYPSLFEGFGLPVLEGMQFGVSTIASNSTSIPEVTGSAAILLNPEDEEAWAQSMLKLSVTPELRAELSELGMRQAGRFDWKQSAQSLLRVYEQALASPKRVKPS